MVKLDSEKIKALLNQQDSVSSTTKKGRILENTFLDIFEKIPGIFLLNRNQLDYDRNQEIDLAFWNEQYRDGLYFLPNIIPIECKNWGRRVDGMHIEWFVNKLKKRGLEYGIVIARNGITGHDNKGAQSVITGALRERIKIIIITKQEIENITDTEQIIKLLKEKLLNLMIYVKVSKT